MNRRVRNRTHGGVRGRSLKAPPTRFQFIYLPKDRRKAPCFSYGDIRRALSCVMWEFAV